MNYIILKIFIKNFFFSRFSCMTDLVKGKTIWSSTYGVWKLASVLICKSTKRDLQIFRYQGMYRCTGIYWAHVHVCVH